MNWILSKKDTKYSSLSNEEIARLQFEVKMDKECKYAFLPKRDYNGHFFWLTTYFKVFTKNSDESNVFFGNFLLEDWAEIQKHYFKLLGSFSPSIPPMPEKKNVTRVDFKRKKKT